MVYHITLFVGHASRQVTHKLLTIPPIRYFLVMKNIFPPPEKEKMDRRYDLKGSWVNRHSGMGNHGEPVKGVLKDTDLNAPFETKWEAGKKLAQVRLGRVRDQA